MKGNSFHDNLIIHQNSVNIATPAPGSQTTTVAQQRTSTGGALIDLRGKRLFALSKKMNVAASSSSSIPVNNFTKTREVKGLASLDKSS